MSYIRHRSSPLKEYTQVVIAADTDLAVADGTAGFPVPSSLDGHYLNAVVGVITSSTLGVGTDPTLIQLRKIPVATGTPADMLTNKLMIDAGERSSLTAATAYTITAANAQVATGDVILPDIDQIPETTAPKGLSISVKFSDVSP